MNIDNQRYGAFTDNRDASMTKTQHGWRTLGFVLNVLATGLRTKNYYKMHNRESQKCPRSLEHADK